MKPVAGVSRETRAREAAQRVGTVGEHVARPVLAFVLVYWRKKKQQAPSVYCCIYYRHPVRESAKNWGPVWAGRTLAWHLARTSAVSVVAVTQRVQTGAVLTGRPFFGLAIVWKKLTKIVFSKTIMYITFRRHVNTRPLCVR